jgi:hypothetical protein
VYIKAVFMIKYGKSTAAVFYSIVVCTKETKIKFIMYLFIFLKTRMVLITTPTKYNILPSLRVHTAVLYQKRLFDSRSLEI